MTGPIYVNGAEPGDVDGDPHPQDRAQAVRRQPELAGKDSRPSARSRPRCPRFIKWLKLDLANNRAEFQAGHPGRAAAFPARSRWASTRTIRLRARAVVKDDPLGTGVGRCARGRTARTMDINELQRLEDLHPGVHQGRPDLDRRFAWPPGNGEVSLTALECSYKEIMIQPWLRKA